MAKITDEFINDQVDLHFDDVVWEVRNEKAFVKCFNNKMRDIVPELKDSKKNFYNIYNKYQPQ